MTLRPMLGWIRRKVLSAAYVRPFRRVAAQPIISMCFDDFPRSAYTVGNPILKRCGARGTYYVSMGLMGKRNELGQQFVLEDLYAVLVDGHELGCHTFSHTSCRAVPLRVFEEDVRRGAQAIGEIAGSEALSFAYPYGHVTLASKRRIGPCMSSCRSIYGGVNEMTVDVALLRANSLYGGADAFPAIKSLIIEAERTSGWLILYTHDVSDSPSAFGCTPVLLEKSLSFALERGLAILPVNEVIGATVSESREPSERANLRSVR